MKKLRRSLELFNGLEGNEILVEINKIPSQVEREFYFHYFTEYLRYENQCPQKEMSFYDYLLMKENDGLT